MSVTGPLPEDDPRKVVQEAPIRVIESKDYHSIHVNGAVGGYNQFGEIYVGLYTERAANAVRGTFQLLDDGSTNVVHDAGSESTGIVREMQVGVFMTPMAAQNLLALLATTLQDLKAAADEMRREDEARRGNEGGA